MLIPFLCGYIDPGSGSLMLQVIIASALGCIVFLKGIPGALVAQVRRRRVRRPDAE